MQHAQDIDGDLDLIRPWRRATIAVSTVAALELIALAAIAIAALGNPLSTHLNAAKAAAGTPRVRATQPATKPALSRADTTVMVLNGGGQAGAAHAAATRVSAHGYQLGQIGNAAGGTSRTLIMYRPGYAAEGGRLGRDLHVRIVRPLDGMRTNQLLGAHLVLIMGR
jgi:hypothetical protein